MRRHKVANMDTALQLCSTINPLNISCGRVASAWPACTLGIVWIILTLGQSKKGSRRCIYVTKGTLQRPTPAPLTHGQHVILEE
jgi:hypothetical protein